MIQKTFELNPKSSFVEKMEIPLVSGDVNAYVLVLPDAAADCGVQITALREDGHTVVETYTGNRCVLPNSMYSVAGQVRLRVSLVQNGQSIYTFKELVFDVVAGHEADLEGEDRLPTLNNLILRAFSMADYAKGQGDYAKEMGDLAKEMGDLAYEFSQKELPAATADTLGGVKVGEGLSVTADGRLTAHGIKQLTVSPDDESLTAADFADGIYHGSTKETPFVYSYYLISVSSTYMASLDSATKFQFLIDTTGVKMRSGKIVSAEGTQMEYTSWVSLTAENNAGAHNAIYRGKFLGSAVTEAQYAAIAAGTFDDLYIGDYWTIGGRVYRIAAFDYYYNTGENVGNRCMQHHVTIVPDHLPGSGRMNVANSAEGGYVSSYMYKEGMQEVKGWIATDFGAEHILNHRTILQYATSGDTATGVNWYDSTVELMTEQNVFGYKCFGDIARPAGSVPAIQTIDHSQFPLFALRPDLISDGQWYWLRDFVNAACFAIVTGGGNADYAAASTVAELRPAFSIVG